jgi:hypothetical protein
MHQRFSPVDRSLDALRSITRDLAHAVRSLAKERAFTLVCVISLGIGMGAIVALAKFTRMIYVLASTIAVSVALLAGLPAARRATSVQPMVAMRSE